MKLNILALLGCILAVIGMACSDAGPSDSAAQEGGSPTHPLLAGVTPPPLNLPIDPEAIRAEPVGPSLPDDDLPAIFVLVGDDPFAGELRAGGSVSASANRIDFESDEGEPLTILYRLPDGMRSLPEIEQQGTLEIAAFSGPASADRRLVISGEGGLLFAQFWQSAEGPVAVELSESVRVAQGEVGEASTESEYVEAEVVLFEANEPLAELPLGEVVVVETSFGELQVFVEVSHLFTPRDLETGQFPAGYILRVWIVGLS